jgi:hypothetical protein
MSYPEELSRELAAVGISGPLRDRITTEIRDHLECDPGAELGSPAAMAAQFANELGTIRTRRAALGAFGALAVAAALSAAGFLIAVRGFPYRHPHSAALGAIAVWMAALGVQIALVSGTLAALRGLRRRNSPTVPRAEAIILLRRATLALLAGVTAMASLALAAIEYDRGVPRSSTTLAVVLAAVATVALLAASPAVLTAARVRPTAEGTAGDMFDDLGRLVPRPLRGHPWVLALLVSGLIVVALTVAGASQFDPYDGAARGVLDGLAFLGCFAVLGGYLGLRPGRTS